MEEKKPITRLNKFFSESDFNFNVQLGTEYLHGDLNMRLILYRVDLDRTDNNSIYGEAGIDEINFLPPVEFNGLVDITATNNKSYNDLVRYAEPGNLKVSVYISHLKELNIDIKYGDYIGYIESDEIVRYYSVIDDGRITSSNANKIFGYKPHYRDIICSPVLDNEFRGI